MLSPCNIILIFLDCRIYHIYRQWIEIDGKVRAEEEPMDLVILLQFIMQLFIESLFLKINSL